MPSVKTEAQSDAVQQVLPKGDANPSFLQPGLWLAGMLLLAQFRISGAETVGIPPVGTNTAKTAKKPKTPLQKFETKEFDDVELREQLKARLALAERHNNKTKQEMDDYRSAIRELDERIAKGPSVSERFAALLEKFLTFDERQTAMWRKERIPQWTPELEGLLDALRGRTPNGPLYCETELALLPAHAARELNGVPIRLLLPYAKKEILHSPAATELHSKYVRALILAARDEESEDLEQWLKFFEFHKMEWEHRNFETDVKGLKEDLRRQQTDKEGASAKANASAVQPAPAKKGDEGKSVPAAFE